MAIAVRKTVWQSLDEFEDSFGVSWVHGAQRLGAVLKQILSSFFMISSILEQEVGRSWSSFFEDDVYRREKCRVNRSIHQLKNQ